MSPIGCREVGRTRRSTTARNAESTRRAAVTRPELVGIRSIQIVERNNLPVRRDHDEVNRRAREGIPACLHTAKSRKNRVGWQRCRVNLRSVVERAFSVRPSVSVPGDVLGRRCQFAAGTPCRELGTTGIRPPSHSEWPSATSAVIGSAPFLVQVGHAFSSSRRQFRRAIRAACRRCVSSAGHSFSNRDSGAT